MIPMLAEILLETPEHESEEELSRVVTEFVTRLTGKQTIYQMIQLAEEVTKRGESRATRWSTSMPTWRVFGPASKTVSPI